MAQASNATTSANARAEIARAGYSAADVARSLKWSTSRLGRRLTGETPFDIDELVALADTLGIPLARLVETTDTAVSA